MERKTKIMKKNETIPVYDEETDTVVFKGIQTRELNSILTQHSNVTEILEKELCTKELLKRIIKDFVINDERQYILEDINSRNLKLDEAKYKFFKSIYKSQAMKNVF